MRAILAAAAVLLAAGMGLTDGAGATVEVEGLVIADGRARTAGGPTARSAAGYFTITNEGTENDRLIGVESPAAQRVALHTHELENGIARMVELEAVPVPAGKTVAFEPGGRHVMFMGLRDPWGAEGGVVVTLLFERAGEVPVTLSVDRVGHRHRPDMSGEQGRVH